MSTFQVGNDIKHMNTYNGLTMKIVILIMIACLCVHGKETNPAEPSDRECVQSSNCQCTNLWDSDCICSNIDAPTQCNDLCKVHCEEIWTPRSLDSFGIEGCNFPKYKKFSLKLFTFAKNATNYLSDMKSLMEVFYDAIDFEIVYTVVEKRYSDGSSHFESPYGPLDIHESQVHLCTMYEYRDPADFLPFLTCVSAYNPIEIGFRNCSRLHGIDMDRIEACVEENGNQLLSMSSRTSREYNIFLTSLVVADGRRINPLYFRSLNDSVSLMCKIFFFPQQLFPWWMFEFLGALFLSMFMLLFVVKGVNIYEVFRL